MSLTVFQDFVKMFQVVHYHIAVLFQNRQGDEEVEITTELVRPEAFPQAKYVIPYEFALIPDQKHTEKEEKVSAIRAL